MTEHSNRGGPGMDVVGRLNEALAGRYRLEKQVGEGGMSTVYLADDLKHNRKVALKILKPELAAVVGADRFLAEIETTANLQHPHILPLFDSGEADGFLFFVMPYIDGETLADKIDREKQLPVDEAVGIATAVASALSVAHEQGVIHRDIKPGNVLLLRGEPLVTDFGIAIAVTKSSGARLTETGLSVGTPYYMSPEQATGDREITAASDVYALGCVLYEMLVGEPPYVGNTAQAVLGRILTEKPRTPTSVRAVVPGNVEGAVMKSLEKLPADRFRSASGFVRALQDSSFRYGEEDAAVEKGSAQVSTTWRLAAIVASVVAIAALIFSAFGPGPSTDGGVLRLDLSMGDLEGADFHDPAISPDGTMIAVTAFTGSTPAIYLRRTGEADFHKIPGTDGGEAPAFSPNNQWIVFRDRVREALVRVSPEGGGALTLVQEEGINPYFPHWGDDGSIVHSGPTGTFLINPAGDVRRLAAPGLGRRPFLLPDGSGVIGAPTTGGVHIWSAETDSTHLLIPEGLHPTYVNTGHILYVSPDGGLYAQPFNLRDHALTGTPARVLDRIRFNIRSRGYALSASGTLIHFEGDPSFISTREQTRFVLVDPDGLVDTVPLPPASRGNPRFSPNGRFLAYEFFGGSGTDSDIHTFDLVTGYEQPLTFGGDNEEPIWSPDGQELLFDMENPESAEDLQRKWADNRAPEENILTLPGDQNTLQWLPGDTVLFETDHSAGGNADLYLLDLNGEGNPQPFLQSPWLEVEAQVSPDRTLAALMSNETGDMEIWLRTFPDPTGKWQVSRGGGSDPRWAPDGSGVYYWTEEEPEDRLMFAPVDRKPSIRVAPPREVLRSRRPNFGGGWDVHPDGNRFLITVSVLSAGVSATDSEGETPRHLFVLNWIEELKRRLEEAR